MAEDPRLRPRGHGGRYLSLLLYTNFSKGNVSDKFTLVQSIKSYEDVDLKFHLSLASALDGNEWLFSSSGTKPGTNRTGKLSGSIPDGVNGIFH